MSDELKSIEWDWLHKNCLGLHRSKKNDVKRIEISKAIRRKAKEKGYTSDQVDNAMSLTGKFHRATK